MANEEGKQPGKHVANTDLDDSLTHRIDQWRRSRLPALIRLERSYAQAHHALAHTQAEIDRLLHGPTHVQATAPSDGSELVNRVHDMHAKLLRQEEGLQAICWQLHKRLQAAQAEAEALSDKRARTRRLVNLLSRCRCVYEVRVPHISSAARLSAPPRTSKTLLFFAFCPLPPLPSASALYPLLP